MLSISNLRLPNVVQYWGNICKDKYELATQCVANYESVCLKDMCGYNLGTPALKPYKREIKTHQNDTILKEKAM